MNPSPSPTPFASAHFRSRLVRILLIIGIVVDGLALVSQALAIRFPTPTKGQEIGDAPVGFAVALFILTIALLSVLVYFSAVIAFCMWLHRAYKNLSAFGASRLGHSAGWAVGSFFVPFVNLVVPYRAIKELWQKSIPPEQSRLAEPSPPAWFPVWWTFWLLCSWAGNISFRLSFNEGVSESVAAGASIAADILAIVAALFALVVVGDIDKRQEETANTLGLKTFGGPLPPPPRFDETHVSMTNNPSTL